MFEEISKSKIIHNKFSKFSKMKKSFPPKLKAGTAECLYGFCTVIFDDNSIFALGFSGLDEALNEFADYFKGVDIEIDNLKATKLIENIFENGINPEIVLKGTNFQMSVWHELSKIPKSETVTYSELAARIGKPKAARAVGNAVGANPVAFLVPCHRIVRVDGNIGGFRWGTNIKEKILLDENPDC